MKREMIISMAFATAMSVMPAFAQEQPATPGATAGGAADVGAKAAGKGKFERRGGGGRYTKLQEVLTADQKEKFNAILEQSRSESKPLFQKMRAMREQMQGTSTMDSKTKNEFVALRKQMKQNHEATQTKILALLTPEQKAKLEANGGLNFGHGDGGEGSKGGWGGHRHGGGRWKQQQSEGTAAPTVAPATAQ